MKIQFYAPDTSMPKGTTAARAAYFRAWAEQQLRVAYRGHSIEVMSAKMLDETYQLAAVEGARPWAAAEVHTFCEGLWERFYDLHEGPDHDKPGPRGRQVWIGGICQWKDS